MNISKLFKQVFGIAVIIIILVFLAKVWNEIVNGFASIVPIILVIAGGVFLYNVLFKK